MAQSIESIAYHSAFSNRKYIKWIILVYSTQSKKKEIQEIIAFSLKQFDRGILSSYNRKTVSYCNKVARYKSGNDRTG
jgi:hypothetical protein